MATQRTELSVDSLKRQALLVLFSLSAVALVIDTFATVFAPLGKPYNFILLGICFALGTILWLKKETLPTISLITYASCVVAMLVQSWTLFQLTSLPFDITLYSLFPWLAVNFILGFLFFGTNRGLLLAATLTLVETGIGLHSSLSSPLSGTVNWVGSLLVNSGILISFLYIFAKIKDQLVLGEAVIERMSLLAQRYKLIYEHTPIGLITFDETGTITAVNKHLLEIVGAERAAEVVGLNICSLPESIAVDFDEDFRRLMANRELTFREAEWTSPWKKKAWVRCKTSGIVSIGGQVREVIGTVEDITKDKEYEAQIKELGFRDPVTGLHNRTYFEHAARTLDAPEHLPLSVIIGDVNGLKLVNDTFGHSTGDILLKKIARILQDVSRPGDLLFRWGGDEFVLLLPNTGQETATLICREVKWACEQADQQPIRPTIALGSDTKSSPEKAFDLMMRTAESRMYRAKLLESTSTRGSIIASLTSTLREKSFETEEHAGRMQSLARSLGEQLHLSDSTLDELVLLAALHDIGKVSIPETILTKSGRLTEAEWEQIKQHPEIGYRIAKTSPDLAPIAEAILSHHERWDGAGYPRGLRGEEIPLIARIISVIDAFDVMTNGRPYRGAISTEEALVELNACAGTQFDPNVVFTFAGMLQSRKARDSVAATKDS